MSTNKKMITERKGLRSFTSIAKVLKMDVKDVYKCYDSAMKKIKTNLEAKGY